MAAADQVGTLVAKLQFRGGPESLVEPDLRRAINSVVDRGLCSGTNDFVRRSHISKGTLSALLNGKKAGLDTWVRVSLAADVSLAGLFAPELWQEGVIGRSISWRSAISTVRQRAPLPWKDIRDKAAALARSASAISVYEFGRQLNAEPQHLKKGLGPLAAQLDDAAAQARAREAESRAEALAGQIDLEASGMKAEGLRISARSLAKRLKRGGQSVDFVSALRKAMPPVRPPGHEALAPQHAHKAKMPRKGHLQGLSLKLELASRA